ncbi:MAG: hypothetical protein E7640_04460 [Ruminococcaceae bacterium]|nr:hypothetical protein [Oscillospiraceae bacterium]
MKNSAQKRRSITATVFSNLVSWLYSRAVGGFFGKIFTSYSKMNEVFKRSLAVSLLGNGSHAASDIRKFRFRIAELFEESAILRLMRRISAFFVNCRVRFYGSFMLVFGIYTGLIYFLKRYAFPTDTSDEFYFWFAVAAILIALPLLICKKTLAETLAKSRSGNFMINEMFGIQTEKLGTERTSGHESYNIAIVFGIIAGSVTYFLNPIYIIMFIVLLMTVGLVMSYPEIGVLLTALILPFASAFGDRDTVIVSMVCLYSFAYIIKLIRGKRVLKVNVYDFLTLLFGVVILVGGISGFAGEGGKASARIMAVMVFGGFIALNLIRTSDWLRRTGFAIFCSSFTASLLILWKALMDIAPFGSMFYLGEARFFENTNDTALYLLMSFGVALAALNLTKNRKLRLLIRLGLFTMPIAIIVLGSRTGMLGVAVAFLAYCIVNRMKTVGVLICGTAATAYIGFMMPGRMLFRAFDVFDGFVLAFWRTLDIWQGAIGTAISTFFVGAGVGSFELIYPRLSLVGSEAAGEASSLFINMLCELGIIGFIIFIVALFLFVQNCFEYIKIAKDKASCVMVSGGLCAVFGMLCAGLFFDIFSSLCVFYMFWLLCSFTVACIRIGRAEEARSAYNQLQSETSASIDL